MQGPEDPASTTALALLPKSSSSCFLLAIVVVNFALRIPYSGAEGGSNELEARSRHRASRDKETVRFREGVPCRGAEAGVPSRKRRDVQARRPGIYRASHVR